MLTSGRRKPEEGGKKKKTRHEGGRGKLYFLSYSLLGLQRRAGGCARAGFRGAGRATRAAAAARRSRAPRPAGAPGMWDPQDFERHWQAEFPGQAAPVMRLDSVLDVERELERCKRHLKRLQQVSAEEKFKASYLQSVLAREQRGLGCGRREGAGGGGGAAASEEPAAAGPERAPPLPREEEEEEEGAPGGGDGELPGPARPDPEVAAQAETPCVCLDLPAWPVAAGPGATVRSLTAAIHQQLLQSRLLFRPREDCAPLGHEGSVPEAPGEEPASGTRAGRGSEEGEPDAPGAEDGGDSSDHDFEMVDLNEKFVLGHLLVAPCRFGTRGEAEKAARASSPHRWMHLIPGGRRLQRRSRDLEPLESEAQDGRGSPSATDEAPRRGARDHLPRWRRKGLLWVPERDSHSHSSPERGSDCSHNSSDHEDGFSAGRRTPP